MASHNLVLIHPIVDCDYDDPSLIGYYTEWIPELLAEAKPAMLLKSIQPVAWNAPEGMAARARRLFGDGAWLLRDDEKEARALLSAIQKATKALTTVRLDLEPITEKHIATFCEDNGFSDAERQSLIDCIRGKKDASSREILVEIDQFMRRRRGGEARV